MKFLWFLLLTAVSLRLAIADAAEPRTGAALLKTDLLGVFAHPDDETGVAATLAHYALGQGKVVAAVYCTRGEGGGNMVGTHFGASLGLLREVELRDCLRQLGIQRVHFLGQPDFGYTESLSLTFERWGHDATLERLVRLVRALRPEVIVTMNPAPTSGQHGNHQAAAVLAIEAFDAAADPSMFPQQILQEGLTAWRPRKLYVSDRANGGTTLRLTTPLPGGDTPVKIAAKALSEHRSQGFGNMASSPWFARMTQQSFSLFKSVVPFEKDESDLFQGLPVEGDTPERVLSEKPGTPNLSLRFAPTPAVAEYWRWGRRQRLEEFLADFEPEFALAREEEGLAVLDMGNRAPKGANAALRFIVPAGWEVHPAETTALINSRPGTLFPVAITPPRHAKTGDEIQVVAKTPQGELRATGRLRILPTANAPRVAAVLDVATDAGWETLAAFEIPSTNTWQGTVSSPADLSATARVGHDDQFIYVEVVVHDDKLVSNIEPNDVRGHWRSDSVELCFDPHQASEHTFECYKLGIFPFDTEGHIQAARDADAHPGPVAQSAPGTRLASKRTADGYRIRAAVPLREIGLDYPRSRRLGFNVLIYDGDKTEAKPGENINKSRIAWHPRAGVQGRPEEWGRLVLE